MFSFERRLKLTPCLLVCFAMFSLIYAARVELLGDENHYKDPKTGEHLKGVESWVAAFQKKILEIDSKRCKPFE